MSLAVRGLRHSYPAPDGSATAVLDVPELDLAAGEQVALTGGSGTGKTTLLHCLAGIVRPDAGEVRVGDTDVARLGEARRDAFRGHAIGYVFQQHHLLPSLTAVENVLLGMTFAAGRADPGHAAELLGAVGLGDRRDHKPGQLSIGQRQRVAVARSLANRPTLLLADEPTGSLDPDNAAQVIGLLTQLARDAGATTIVVTHDRDVAARLPRTMALADVNLAARRSAA